MKKPPKIQPFGPLDAATEAALRASIVRFGVIVPVVKTQDGRIIDGHHRSRIAGELNVSYAVDVRNVADEDEAHELARSLNADRRQLTQEQRQDVVLALASMRSEDDPGARVHSPNAIAAALGVDRMTVVADERQLESARKLEPAEFVIGLDGKTRSARRPKSSDESPATGDATPKRKRHVSVKPSPKGAPVYVVPTAPTVEGVSEGQTRTIFVAVQSWEAQLWSEGVRGDELLRLVGAIIDQERASRQAFYDNVDSMNAEQRDEHVNV